MSDRHPYSSGPERGRADRDADRDARERDQLGRQRYGRDDRNFAERTGDEVRSWFGDEDASRRRRLDEERARARPSRWGDERSYSSDREYGDRDYGWRDDRVSGWNQDDASITRDSHGPSNRDRAHPPRRSEYSEYDRHSYGGPYGRERFGAREWSSTESWRVPGPHTGRGPRGYQRSDERIREEVSDRLTAHGLIDATDIEIRVEQGEVTLTGFVDSRAAKRAAEDVADDIHGVREVHNHVRVRGRADEAGVGQTSVLGLNETRTQTPSPTGPGDTGRSRTRN